MRRLLLVLASAAFAHGQDTDEALLHALRDKDPSVRLGAARILGGYRKAEAVEPLIVAAAEEQDTNVRKEIFLALRSTTGQSIGDDVAQWRAWFDKEGSKFRRTLTLATPSGGGQSNETFMVVSLVFNILLFLLIAGALVAFGAMASNRMKAMKELTKSAETIIREGNEAQNKSGSVLAALDVKKAEIVSFFGKLKEENESEIERYSDLIEQNIEHRMREITMQLREKAEKELDQTFQEMKEDIDRRVRNASEAQKDVLIRELSERQQRFLADVEAHTLFLEASFYYISGKLPDALRVYKKLLTLKPDHYIAWNNYGTILRDLLRFDEAAEAYEKALALSPDNAGVFYLFATLHAMQKRKDKMLEYLKKSITFDAEFKDEALNDKSFKEYWEDAEFKDLAEA